jgi:ABC-2 type transport system ATP-binding protein
MSNVVEVINITKTYGNMTAIKKLNFSLAENKIYGLLGSNGAGKTTLMNMITAQLFPSSGEIKVFGEDPYENRNVLKKVCFIKESQKYPDYFRVSDIFSIGAKLYQHWDKTYAQQLIKDFRLPLDRLMKELSRGQLSAVGIVIGLASRAELTIFDEPYLGLDAVARSLFYDHLLQDYATHPRTIILSTHLIDEVSQLLETILLIDEGKLLLHDDIETIIQRVYAVSGQVSDVNNYVQGKEILHQEQLGSLQSTTIYNEQGSDNKQEIEALGLTYQRLSLQQVITYLTSKKGDFS